MAKHKTPTANVASEPAAEYIRIRPKGAARAVRGHHPLARAGAGGHPLPMREFKRIAKSIPLSMEVWSGVLHVPLVRWKRRLAGTAALQPLETDRVLHIHELYRMGEKIFGSAPAMARWMEHPHWLFGKAPLAMLTSQQGIEEVMAEIGRIEHGIPA